MMLFPMMLSGCFQTTVKEYVEVNAPIPDELIYNPCDPIGPGNTHTEIYISYVKNVGCIGEYKGVVEGLETYNNKIKEGINARKGK